jgi:hypothetical protein
MRRMILLITMALLPYLLPPALAQEIYRTTKGNIGIRAVWNNEMLYLKSESLQMFIDYETASFSCVLDLGTIVTSNDSITEVLQRRSGIKAFFMGKLSLSHINTSKNGIERFTAEGRLELMNRQSFLTGTGILEHLYEGTNYVAMVTMYYSLRFSQINFAPPMPGLADEFHIEIAQAVLRKEM